VNLKHKNRANEFQREDRNIEMLRFKQVLAWFVCLLVVVVREYQKCCGEKLLGLKLEWQRKG
jgi:hypothetical protein